MGGLPMLEHCWRLGPALPPGTKTERRLLIMLENEITPKLLPFSKILFSISHSVSFSSLLSFGLSFSVLCLLEHEGRLGAQQNIKPARREPVQPALPQEEDPQGAERIEVLTDHPFWHQATSRLSGQRAELGDGSSRGAEWAAW
eukprot:m.146745 g.146745  ORF g.146745 m.146745 type:complete len:144 (-) comp52716_c1_seq16:191-622(-)